ncbi:hypothetical protein [Salinisphaera sp. T31B1]|uniref:hypothetical protein n=1 Tax=Salinisphaera sp. T31B1 TaxID=727963 RepID=UPI003340FFB4
MAMTNDRLLAVGIPLRSIGRWFAWCTVFLTVAVLIVVALRVGYRYDRVYGLYALFDLDGDSSVPTWYASISLLVCSGLLYAHGRISRAERDRRIVGWYGLALIFLFLSVD